MTPSETFAVASNQSDSTRVRAWLAHVSISHPLLFTMFLALAVRVFIAVVLTKYFSGTLVLDDTTYHYMAAQMAEGATAAWDEFTFQLFYSTGAFMIPITALYKIFGPAALTGQLFVVMMGTFAAVFVTRTAMEFMSPRWAVVAGAIVALLPSQAFWSSMLMKDASVWFALTGLGAVIAVASRSTGKRLAFLAAPAAGFLIMLSYLRLHTLVVAVWALMIAVFFSVKKDKVARVAGALSLGIAIPWIFGAIGPAGYALITQHGSLEERRFLNAQGANTAIVPKAVYPQDDKLPVRDLEAQAAELEAQATEIATTDPDGAEELLAEAREVRAEAKVLKVVPPSSVEGSGVSLNPNLRHLPRGLSVMLFEPLPVPFDGSISLKLARLESLIWYPLLLLSAIGLWNVRAHLRHMAFSLLVGGGIVLMYALTEGNVGTAHRHRGEFVWVVALLATIGLSYLSRRWSSTGQGQDS